MSAKKAFEFCTVKMHPFLLVVELNIKKYVYVYIIYIYINNLLVEANIYSATTRTKGCILTVQNSNAFSANTHQEFTSDNTKYYNELKNL